jgi:hypothetical protein
VNAHFEGGAGSAGNAEAEVKAHQGGKRAMGQLDNGETQE